MVSRWAGMVRRGAAAASMAAASMAVALLQCSVASAQSDAGASAPAEPDPHAAVPAEPDPSGPAPGAGPAEFPKALTPQQRMPENLQGWLRERNGRRAVSERPPLAPPLTRAPAQSAPEANAPDVSIDGYKRRLHSFNEGGVTVLSNRHAVPPPLARVRAAEAVVVPTPVPMVAEQEPEEPTLTETRSLRTDQLKASRLPSEQSLSWTVFAVPVAAISLTLLWLRKRRTSS
ncbi:MAG: hypothetical protein ABI895_38525 [Deltaproteobacteria bacterium]